MTLNNKGFAITGILYTLFILFLLLLVSVLGALSSRKKMSEASTKILEDNYTGTVVNLEESISVAPVLGRYKFKFIDNDSGESYYCYAYLKKNTNLENINEIIFTNSDCNTYKGNYNFELVEVVSFDN